MRKIVIVSTIILSAFIILTGCKKNDTDDESIYNAATENINDVILQTTANKHETETTKETATKPEDSETTIAETKPAYTTMYVVGQGRLFQDKDLGSFSPCSVDYSNNGTLKVTGESDGWYQVYYEYFTDIRKEAEGTIWYIPKEFVSSNAVVPAFYTMYPCITTKTDGSRIMSRMWWYESEDDEDINPAKSTEVYNNICSKYGLVNPSRNEGSGVMTDSYHNFYIVY